MESPTHVVVGYSAALLAELDGLLPAASVLLLEEPHILAVRGARERVHRCLAGVHAAPTQEKPDRLADVVARPPGIRAVVPGGEYGVPGAAVLADAWGLPGAGPAAARMFRDKLLLREAAATKGVTQPGWAEVRGPEEIARFLAGHGECVLKPSNRQASVGVRFLTLGDDVTAAWRWSTAADEPEARVGRGGDDRFMVEERLVGRHVSVEVLVRGGEIGFLNVSELDFAGGLPPVSRGHTVPASLPAHVVGDLENAMADLVAATGFGTGMLHAEWMLVGERPHLIECAARLPGDHIPTLISFAYGVGFPRQFLTLLEGGRLLPRRPPVAAAAIRFVTADPGTVTEVTGEREVMAQPGVHDVRVHVAPGTVVEPAVRSSRHAGHVIALAATPDDAERRARAGVARIGIRTARVPAPR
jgi:biotin carboxylase